jgi:hypothetical protein
LKKVGGFAAARSTPPPPAAVDPQILDLPRKPPFCVTFRLERAFYAFF